MCILNINGIGMINHLISVSIISNIDTCEPTIPVMDDSHTQFRVNGDDGLVSLIDWI